MVLFSKRWMAGRLKAVLLGLLIWFPMQSGYSQQIATYELTFESEWSPATHPSSFPSTAHFSGLIGTTHTLSTSYWSPGALASDGIKSMAETGSKVNLRAIFDVTDAQGVSDVRIDGPGLATSPSSVTISFQVRDTHPLLTLVSMIAPSPDWFVGVMDYPLMELGAWKPQIAIDLYAWDAGTDSGTSYTSANQATQPPVGIQLISTEPFAVAGNTPRVGRFILELLSVTHVEPNETPTDQALLLGSYPNPFSYGMTLTYTVAERGHIAIAAYDVSGRLIDSLVSESKEKGLYELNWTPSRHVTGPIMIRMAAGAQVISKMVYRVQSRSH